MAEPGDLEFRNGARVARVGGIMVKIIHLVQIRFPLRRRIMAPAEERVSLPSILHLAATGEQQVLVNGPLLRVLRATK